MKPMTLQERFDAKYIGEPMSGCWLWEAGLNSTGYGLLSNSDYPKGATIVIRDVHMVGFSPWRVDCPDKPSPT